MLAEVDAQANSELQSFVENKWGFLKNIININTFFSSPDGAESESAKTVSDNSSSKKN